MIKIFRNLKKRDLLFIFFSTALIVFQVWLDLKMPDYTQKLTQSISSGDLKMKDVRNNGMMMLLCAFGSMLASMACGFFTSQVAANFSKTLRTKLFGKIMTFSSREINKFSTPSLITRTTNDVIHMQMLLAVGAQVLIKAPITAVWAILKISNTNMKWTTAVIICVVEIVCVISVLVALAFPKFRMIQKLTDKLNDTIRENLSGVRVVRAFNAESYEEAKFDKVNENITKNHLFTSRILGLMMPVLTMSMSGLTLAIYWIGACIIKETQIMGRAEVMGNMVAFTQYALQVVSAFMMLILIFILLPRTMVSAGRINEVLDTEVDIEFKETGVSSEKNGTVQFKNVSFRYNDAPEYCLKNIDFTINKGETFAVIGATGTGKTSLINLIPRFYDVSEGEVLIDGVNVKEYSEKELVDKVSLAPQKATLFSGTIKSNITYGCDESKADDDRLTKALEISSCDFVNDLPLKEDTSVAQGATNFSGGQKQRMSIARAVYKDSEILIFDDTFSALDYKTDMMVRKSLKEKLSDKTIIIVAQRIGTIKNADKILVLNNGETVGIGTHEELLKNCSVYKEIALSQLSEDELNGMEEK